MKSSGWAGMQRLGGWLTHLLTAIGGGFGLLALAAVGEGRTTDAFWLLACAVVIDALDGTLARRMRVTESAPQVDGTLLDNLVDFLNYVIVPAYMLTRESWLPAACRLPLAVAIVLASAFQFAQRNAKTPDHFFKGFPSYWNIVVLYFMLWQTPPWLNLFVTVCLVCLVFVPVKYVYPTRLEFVSRQSWVRRTILAATGIWAVLTIVQLWRYPAFSPSLALLSGLYIAGYFALSIYRTLVPLPVQPADGGV